ncbi:MAG: hypothetical protein IT435_05305 [Phycisphaerales bacterium]|nr:hypothetical protein [Phycisphaerales bacterium]
MANLGRQTEERGGGGRILREGVLVAACACVLVGGCSRRAGGEKTEPLEVVRILGEVGTAPGQFAYPRAMDFDGKYLWVVDKSARVQRVDAETGKCAGGWVMPEYLLGKPTGVTIAPGDDGEMLVWVPDTHYHRVVAYRMPEVPGEGVAGREMFLPGQPPVIAEFGSYGEGPGQFVYPTDVAVLMDDAGKKIQRVYVSEYGGNDRITVWEPDGKGTYAFAFSFGVFGEGSSAERIEFNRPQSIEIGRGGGGDGLELVVADACNHRIGRFTLEGKLIAWIGSPETAGDGPGQFKYPYGLCLLGDGTGMVAEFGNNRVQHVDLATGKGLGSFGGAGRGPGHLINPWAVTVVGDDVFVLDSQNNRVVVAQAAGIHSDVKRADAGWGSGIAKGSP